MRSLRIVVAGAALLLAAPGAAPGQVHEDRSELTGMIDGRSNIFEGREIYVERFASAGLVAVTASDIKEDGDGYLVDEDGVATCWFNCLVYKPEPVYAPDGEIIAWQPRLLSWLEVAVLAGTSPGSDAMLAYGLGMMGFQEDFNQGLTGSTDPTGGIDRVQTYRKGVDCLPSDFQGPLPANANAKRCTDIPPWMDPFSMMYAGGGMIVDASEGLREAEESLARSADLAQEDFEEGVSVLSRLERRGPEKAGDRNTVHFAADGLDLPLQAAEDQQFEIERTSLWIDPEELVLVKHRWEGTATADGVSRDFFIEVVNYDFRHPPGCGEMYEPYRRVQRMGGILDEAQVAEIEKARQQLEEFDRQLAEMPAEQRAMAERMMGSQLDAVRNMADGGAIEHVTEVEEILCDPDLKALFGTGMEEGLPDGRLARIQRHLVTLGYEPGNTNGVLDESTRSAITQFQTDYDLQVTGEPSAELEEVLAAEVEELGTG